VDDLYALARADMGQMHYVTERLDLAPIVQAVVDAFQDRAAAAGVALTVGAHAPDSTILCDGARMRQVLINLLENAVRYTDAGGAIRIEAESDDGWLCISIDDSAPGVPEPLIGRIGERFFRTDAARAAKRATTVIPIVFPIAGDPVGTGAAGSNVAKKRIPNEAAR